MRDVDPPPCVLEPGTEFSGLLQLNSPGRIEGRIDGEVVANDLLWIGGSAHVRARVTAPEIVVAGVLEGEAQASTRIELLDSARVSAVLDTPRLVLAEGSFFRGRCRTRGSADREIAGSAPNPAPPSS